jgi:hypothetical protein
VKQPPDEPGVVTDMLDGGILAVTFEVERDFVVLVTDAGSFELSATGARSLADQLRRAAHAIAADAEG